MARIALTVAGVMAGAAVGWYLGPGAGLEVWQAIPGGQLKGASLLKPEKTTNYRRKPREPRHGGSQKR